MHECASETIETNACAKQARTQPSMRHHLWWTNCSTQVLKSKINPSPPSFPSRDGLRPLRRPEPFLFRSAPFWDRGPQATFLARRVPLLCVGRLERGLNLCACGHWRQNGVQTEADILSLSSGWFPHQTPGNSGSQTSSQDPPTSALHPLQIQHSLRAGASGYQAAVLSTHNLTTHFEHVIVRRCCQNLRGCPHHLYRAKLLRNAGRALCVFSKLPRRSRPRSSSGSRLVAQILQRVSPPQHRARRPSQRPQLPTYNRCECPVILQTQAPSAREVNLRLAALGAVVNGSRSAAATLSCCVEYSGV